MTVRAIDLQVLIPRVTEVGRVQQAADHQATLQQQLGADQWQHLSAVRQQQVQRTPQNAGGRVEADAEHGGHQQEDREQGGRRRHEEAEESPSPDPVRGHTIDIKT